MAIKIRVRTRFKFPLNSLFGIFIILTSKRRFPVTKIEKLLLDRSFTMLTFNFARGSDFCLKK